MLRQAFIIWSNITQKREEGEETYLFTVRIGQYLHKWADPTYLVEPPFEEWELELNASSNDVFKRLCEFAYHLASGTLDKAILQDNEYMSTKLIYKIGGSNLESVFALWANRIEIDEFGKVTNEAAVKTRVAQYIREWWVDSSYKATPKFEDWELGL